MIAKENVPEGYSVGASFNLGGFYAILAKAKTEKADEEKFAYVAGIFSADTKDLDGEILDQDGLAEGLKKFFVPLNANLDWEHGYSKAQDPDFLIGECVKFEPRTLQKNGVKHRAHWGVFRLFKQKKLAMKVLKHLEAGGKIGASVHGVKLVPTSGGGRVNKVAITRISLTPNPVNTDTDITLYDEFMKALNAQSGAAMIPEDLEGDAKPVLFARVKRLAENFLKQGLSPKETRKALADYFDENLKKGDLQMNNLSEVTADLTKALEADEVSEPTGEDKKALTFFEKAFSKLGYKLTKANANEEGEEEDEEGEGEEEFGKARAYLKGLKRESLIKMAKAAGIADDVKGKKADDVVDRLTAKLNKSGTVALVKKYRAEMDKAFDPELAAQDEALIKSIDEGVDVENTDAEGLDDELGEEVVTVGDEKSYKDLTKSISALERRVREDGHRYDEPICALGKAVVGIVERQKESDERFVAFCKALRLPAFDRTPLASTAKVDVTPKGAEQTLPVLHDNASTYASLQKAVVEGKLTAAQVAVTKNHMRKGEELPTDVEAILFPPQ